jgi:pimeloyl-ACP methyl ester carboxylesterase
MRTALTLLLLLASAPAVAAKTSVGPTRVLRVADAPDLELVAETGRLEVPESRRVPGPRRIGLPWYRFRSTAATPGTPIFLLAGGPGASWMRRLEENREYLEEVAFYRGIADVVVFDQRGAGDASPRLTCEQTADLPAEQPLTADALASALRTALAACRDRHLADGVNLAAYDTVENAADVDALRRHFGYERITLLGGSYGSHLALQVLRAFPGTVDRALLTGIEGPGHTWDDPGARLATLARIAADIERSGALADADLPDTGLLGVLARVLARLERAPVRVEVGEGDEARAVVVDAELVRRIAAHRAGRNDDPLAWPRFLLAMDRGDFRLAARAALAWRRIPIQDPVHWSMDCASGADPRRRRRLSTSPAIRLLGDPNFEYARLCDLWPHHDLGAGFRAPVHSPVPVLIVHGDRDLSTPIENAREVAAALGNARLVEVVGGGHGALYNLYNRWPPARAQVHAFLAGGEAAWPARIDIRELESADDAAVAKENP